MNNLLIIFFIVWSLLIITVLIIGIIFVRQLTAMTGAVKSFDFDTGPVIRESSLGTAEINGCSAKNCVRMYEYEGGFALKLKTFFSSGSIWIERDAIEEVKRGYKENELQGYVDLVTDVHTVRLFGKLADFFCDTKKP